MIFQNWDNVCRPLMYGIENVINTYLYAQCVLKKHTLVGKVKAIISLLVCIASSGMSNYTTVKGKCSDVLPI